MRDELLRLKDRVIEKVETPEWSPYIPFVYVAEFSAKERLELFATIRSISDAEGIKRTGIMATYAICDENGNRVLTSADADAIMERKAEPIDRILKKWCEINGLDAAIEKDNEKKS